MPRASSVSWMVMNRSAILNMWTLYIFGPALEDRLGPARFAVLYLLAGVAASATHATHAK